MSVQFNLSPRFSFIPDDYISILKGAAIAGGGVFATYLLEALSQQNFGEYTPIFVGVISILINIVRKWVGENSYATKK